MDRSESGLAKALQLAVLSSNRTIDLNRPGSRATKIGRAIENLKNLARRPKPKARG